MSAPVESYPEPTEQDIRGAYQVNLARRPATEPAKRLSEAVAQIIAPHLARSRALGAKGMASLNEAVGIILAGLLHGGPGHVVRAQRSPSAPIWQGSPIGRDAFWSRVEAMEKAGLIATRNGGAIDFFGAYKGLATALWAIPALWRLADSHGVPPDARKLAWRADADAQSATLPVADDRLVLCVPREGLPLAPTDDMQDRMEVMRRELRALNELLASANIKGAGANVALSRRFIHSLAFHGRLYAAAGSYQTMSESERLAITFNGAPAAEVDVKASSLTVLMGLAKHGIGLDGELPRSDLYAIPDVPRATAKTWLVQTIGRGTAHWSRWADGAAGDAMSPKEVRGAMLARYPFLHNLAALVPSDLLASLPPEHRAWAAGQYVCATEANVMVAALMYCVAHGVPALPVHDSIVVPASSVGVAEVGITDAFYTALRVRPWLKVAPPPTAT